MKQDKIQQRFQQLSDFFEKHLAEKYPYWFQLSDPILYFQKDNIRYMIRVNPDLTLYAASELVFIPSLDNPSINFEYNVQTTAFVERTSLVSLKQDIKYLTSDYAIKKCLLAAYLQFMEHNFGQGNVEDFVMNKYNLLHEDDSYQTEDY